MESDDTLLRPWEVAQIFGVDVKTVARWAKGGLLSSIKTPGGHRRYPKSAVDTFLNTQKKNNNN